MKSLLLLIASCAVTCSALAKLPALSDEAKSKAAEAAAKTAHAGKVDGYLLCKSQDKVATKFRKTSTRTDSKAPAAAPCADPGPFVYTPAPAAAPAAPAAAAPAAAGADKKKS
jgi:hypothetical protein